MNQKITVLFPPAHSPPQQIQLEIILNWDLDPARVKYHCSFNKAFLHSNLSKVCIHQLHGLLCDPWIAQPIDLSGKSSKKCESCHIVKICQKGKFKKQTLLYHFPPSVNNSLYIVCWSVYNIFFIDYRFFMLTLCGKVEYFYLCVTILRHSVTM